MEAREKGTYRTPKRVVFVLFGNGFPEFGSVPKGVSLEVKETQQIPLDQHELPFDIEPFKPYKDRLAIVHGLRGGRVMPYHGGGFGSLSGLFNGAGRTIHQGRWRIDRRRHCPEAAWNLSDSESGH